MLVTFKISLKLRENPNSTADNPLGKVFTTDVATTLQEQGDWTQIQILDGRIGWVKSKWLKPFSTDEIESQIDLELFEQNCVDAARLVGTSAIYLLAIADVESGIRNIPTEVSGGTAFGPFQIIEKTWNSYRNPSDFEEISFSPQDRFDPYLQCYVAALIAHEGTLALSNMEPGDNLPNGNELYMVHLLGLPAARKALKGNRTRSMLDVLTELYVNKPDPAAFAKAVIDNNPSILSSDGVPNTVEETLAAIEVKLTPAYNRAYELLQALPEGELSLGIPDDQPASGRIPWMAVAEAEIGTAEIKGPSGSNPRIEEYFTATTYYSWHPTVTDDTAWCGAFVSWCLQNCQNENAKAKNLRSARAADWYDKGKWDGADFLAKPIRGAIVVLHKTSDSSGHVGFVDSWDDKGVVILAGNQVDTSQASKPHSVCKKHFAHSRIRGYRWLEVA